MNDHTARCTPSVNLMLSFLAGGLTGASVALLLAPRSGRDTREMMRGKLSETAGSARDLRDQLVSKGQKIRDEARHRVDGAVSALAGDAGAKLPV